MRRSAGRTKPRRSRARPSSADTSAWWRPMPMATCLTFKGAACALQSTDISFPTALGVPPQTTVLDHRIDAAWFREPLLEAIAPAKADQGRLPVLIESRCTGEDGDRLERAIYDVPYRIESRLLRGKTVRLRGLVLREHVGAGQAQARPRRGLANGCARRPAAGPDQPTRSDGPKIAGLFHRADLNCRDDARSRHGVVVRVHGDPPGDHRAHRAAAAARAGLARRVAGRPRSRSRWSESSPTCCSAKHGSPRGGASATGGSRRTCRIRRPRRTCGRCSRRAPMPHRSRSPRRSTRCRRPAATAPASPATATRRIREMIADIEIAESTVHLELLHLARRPQRPQDEGRADPRSAARREGARAGRRVRGTRMIRSMHWIAMERAGVDARIALPLGGLVWTLIRGRFDLRNHRKQLIVDNRIAWCGSMNLADPAFMPKVRGSAVGRPDDALGRPGGAGLPVRVRGRLGVRGRRRHRRPPCPTASSRRAWPSRGSPRK